MPEFWLYLESKASALAVWSPKLQLCQSGVQSFSFGCLESKAEALAVWSPKLKLWQSGVQSFSFGRREPCHEIIRLEKTPMFGNVFRFTPRMESFNGWLLTSVVIIRAIRHKQSHKTGNTHRKIRPKGRFYS
jgi:hypothetical protein